MFKHKINHVSERTEKPQHSRVSGAQEHPENVKNIKKSVSAEDGGEVVQDQDFAPILLLPKISIFSDTSCPTSILSPEIPCDAHSVPVQARIHQES